MKLESILQYVDAHLAVAEHPDYPPALNGLQVSGPPDVRHICAAVDASQEVVEAAVEAGADLLLVHHGLFWGGLKPLTGPLFRKLTRLVEGRCGVYSVHLPLDSHGELGNCILLARALGLDVEGRFGTYEGVDIGWWGRVESCTREALAAAVGDAVGGPVSVLPGGPEEVETVAVVTGGASSFLAEAARAGLDAFVTGEGPHHSYVEAMELGVNVLYGGHYATETFGVKALAEHLAERFDLSWEFLDFPSGL